MMYIYSFDSCFQTIKNDVETIANKKQMLDVIVAKILKKEINLKSK